VLTVQQVEGEPIRVGQTLYGGAGLAAGTTITQQISDAAGNLCTDSCNTGGAGVYLVDRSQLVAPGTPMSASDGTGFLVGLGGGAVMQYTNGQFTQLVGNDWETAVNTMIPWRDGFVVGTNNGATFYWSPSNSMINPGALWYAGQTVGSYWNNSTEWSQLHGVGWDNGVTAMVQAGDGIALGLTAPDDSHNGAIEMVTGYGPVDSSSAFGYGPSGALQPSYTFIQPADQSAMGNSNDAYGSVQQLFAYNQSGFDSLGNVVQSQSLVAGLTNNGIFGWDGSNTDTGATSWSTIQQPGSAALSSAMLEQAWTYGQTANENWGSAGGVGDGNGETGDPVFGLQANQAWCGTNCSSEGDYQAFVVNYAFGDDGVIFTLGQGDDLQANLDLSAMAYGYVFVPNGFLDKFKPDYYSAGLLLAAQGGPEAVLNPPDGLYVSDTWNFTGPSYSETKETEFGTFGVDVGLNASVTATIGLSSAPLGPLPLAWAFDTPGLLFTWNTNSNQDSLGLTFANFTDTGVISQSQLQQYFDPANASASLGVTVTPAINLSYGLFSPSSWPISLDLFKLSVGYSNPVTATVTVPLNDFPSSLSNTSLALNAQGILTLSAGILPGITSDLSWNDQIQLYSITDTFYPL
jgi:hypothetical protein